MLPPYPGSIVSSHPAPVCSTQNTASLCSKARTRHRRCVSLVAIPCGGPCGDACTRSTLDRSRSLSLYSRIQPNPDVSFLTQFPARQCGQRHHYSERVSGAMRYSTCFIDDSDLRAVAVTDAKRCGDRLEGKPVPLQPLDHPLGLRQARPLPLLLTHEKSAKCGARREVAPGALRQ